MLCVGLDISSEALGINNLDKLKKHTFTVIDATREYAVAYKPNLAFFERYGSKGFKWLEKTVEYIGSEHVIIADAKRGDIGNTAEQYAKSIFDHFGQLAEIARFCSGVWRAVRAHFGAFLII